MDYYYSIISSVSFFFSDAVLASIVLGLANAQESLSFMEHLKTLKTVDLAIIADVVQMLCIFEARHLFKPAKQSNEYK